MKNVLEILKVIFKELTSSSFRPYPPPNDENIIKELEQLIRLKELELKKL